MEKRIVFTGKHEVAVEDFTLFGRAWDKTCRYAKSELRNFQYFKIRGRIVIKKVSSEIDIYCNKRLIIPLGEICYDISL